MKQFGKIFKFEFYGYLKNKLFVGLTIFLVVAIAIVMFLPNIKNALSKGDEGVEVSPENRPVMILHSENEAFLGELVSYFSEVFPNYTVQAAEDSVDDVKDKITDGTVDCAFIFGDDMQTYTYYVNDLVMSDNNTAIAESAMVNSYRAHAMAQNGLSEEQIAIIMGVSFVGNVEYLGANQVKNFLPAYIMIFALYFVIMLYGQMVATNVASEKSSRAMEVLVTSANPNSMMFGKVFASCFAGFLQLALIFGTAIVCYNINKDTFADFFLAGMFDMPVELFVYMLIFFVLGFLVYAFLYAAIGSTASKLEDINTSTMPITFLFIIAFIVVSTAMSSGSVDSAVMQVCSYIPFTSPMAMFTRIALGNVMWYEIAVSIVILVASVIGIGFISARIYRVGVLLYGMPPKIGNIIKTVFKKQ